MKKQKIFFGLLIVLLVFAIFILGSNWYIVKKLEKELEKGQTTASIEYEDLSVNILTGNASVSSVVFVNNQFTVEAGQVLLRDLSYFNYLSQGKFVIGELEILNPLVAYEAGKVSEDSLASQDSKIEEDIKIKSLVVHNGVFRMPKTDSGQDDLHLVFKNIEIRGLHTNNSIREENLPFEYENVKIESDSIFYQLNDEHNLVVKNISMNEGFAEVKGLQIIPRYSRNQFDSNIPFEKDRIELGVDLLTMANTKWDKVNDSLLFVSSLVEVEKANLKVYRNKLLPDDTRIKPLYSKMLRELSLKLQLDTIRIAGSEIIYHEKTREERPPGELSFSKVEATIANLSNLAGDSVENNRTQVVAQALFMKQAPLIMELEFDVQDLQDQFWVSGRLGTINAKAINNFLKPAMNVEVEGVINSLAYNFYGNRVRAMGEMQLSYQDFKVNILKKGEEKKKSLLSGIVNLFIKNDAVNEDVLQEDLVVERDQTKSFWNFLWLCIREGALKSFL